VRIGSESARTAWLPVVGITREVDLDARPTQDAVPEPTLFVSMPDSLILSWSLVVRPSGDAARTRVRLSTILRTALPVRAGSSVTPWLAAYDQQVVVQQFIDRIFGGLGLASLLLGAAGLFSVLTYVVGQRMREFGVRVALGAAPRNIAWLVVRTGLELTLGGVLIGTVLSVWISHTLAGALYGIRPNDPVSLTGTAVLLAVVTMLAAVVPGWIAMRVDPVDVLRAS
jgi:ABC-type lipoprotein release transport system permease subunit